MSLESAHQRFLRVTKGKPFNDFMFYCFSLPCLASIAIIGIINPPMIAHEDFAVKAILLLAFGGVISAVSLMVGGSFILGGIGITWILIRSRNTSYEKIGIIFGNSLATNHEFLQKLAKGLWTYLLGFIKAFYDPRFDELETKIENGNRDRIENERLYLNHNLRLTRRVEEQNKQIQEKDQKIKQLEEIIDDTSFKADYKQKKLDQFQTKLDDFIV